jgi:hypothetical protein
MNNIIGFSIGTIHLKKETIDQRIEIARETGTRALEISFFNTSEVDQKISPKNIDYLNSLEYVSIHAPMFYKNSLLPYFSFDMNKIKQLYLQTNSKAIVFHPHQNIPSNEKNLVFCVENMPPIPGKDFDLIKKLAEYKLEDRPELRLVLDACHTLHYPGYVEEIVDKYKNRIQHVHLSDRRDNPKKKKTKDHQTFSGCGDKEKFSCLRQLDCPIILEVSFDYGSVEECAGILREEINSVREFFS